MAGIHIRWRKRVFRTQWFLCGAPRYVGSIVAIRDSPDAAIAYAWSVCRRRSAQATNSVAMGVTATLSDAHLLASRAVFAATQMPVGRPESDPRGSASRPRR